MASSSSTSTAAKAVFCLSAVGLLYTARWRADNVVRPFGALPRRLVRRIHALDKKACFLLLHFFEEMGYPLKRLMINGGYVRDLLLGRHADDLDITVCLRQCPQLTVETILHDLARFERLEAFGFKSVKVASIIGDASKDKNLGKWYICMYWIGVVCVGLVWYGFVGGVCALCGGYIYIYMYWIVF